MITIRNRHYFIVCLHYCLYLLTFLTLSRLTLSVWSFDRVEAANGWNTILLQGIRIDIASLCFFLFVPIWLSVFLIQENGYYNRFVRRLLQTWFTCGTVLFLFLELATPSFISEYNLRPNRLFVEYLIYPKEVFGMLLKSRLPELLLATLLTTTAGLLTWKWAGKNLAHHSAINWKFRPIAAVVVLIVATLGVRSTFGHRPLNPSMVYFSNDPLVNSLTLNSFYSVTWSLKQLLSENGNTEVYGKIDLNTMFHYLKEFKGGDEESYISSVLPTYTEQEPSFKGQPKNLVIILEESLGARSVGALHGLSLTPSFDALAKEGVLFKKMFATGTRSVRGIEAVITGFTPTTDRAVVKLDKSQRNFFTIAQLLSKHNYHNEFIYGGEAHFDNMKSFFLGNGFDKITEEKDFENPEFVSSWGVSDEDLFKKADQRFEILSKNNKTFFSLVFSSTNHEPFEYPSGRISPYDKREFTRNNAIRYADWALGQFFKTAKRSSYWNNTVFLVIADHDARSQGTDLVPIKSFHIPALILGNGIKAKSEDRIVSQIDMPPTLLSMIGIENASPMLGTDLALADNNFQGRAILQNGDNFGFLTNDSITILQPEKKATTFPVNWNDFSLMLPRESNETEQDRAKSIALWGRYAYKNDLYRLPKPKDIENSTTTD